jgi:hypothetical protein
VATIEGAQDCPVKLQFGLVCTTVVADLCADDTPIIPKRQAEGLPPARFIPEGLPSLVGNSSGWQKR